MIDFQSNTPRGSGDNIKHKNNVFFDDSRNRLIYNRKCWIAGATHAHDLLAVSLCRACSRCCIAPVSVCVCMNFPAVVLKRSRTFICMGDQSHVPQAGSSLLAGTGSSLLDPPTAPEPQPEPPQTKQRTLGNSDNSCGSLETPPSSLKGQEKGQDKGQGKGTCAGLPPDLYHIVRRRFKCQSCGWYQSNPCIPHSYHKGTIQLCTQCHQANVVRDMLCDPDMTKPERFRLNYLIDHCVRQAVMNNPRFETVVSEAEHIVEYYTSDEEEVTDVEEYSDGDAKSEWEVE